MQFTCALETVLGTLRFSFIRSHQFHIYQFSSFSLCILHSMDFGLRFPFYFHLSYFPITQQKESLYDQNNNTMELFQFLTFDTKSERQRTRAKAIHCGGHDRNSDVRATESLTFWQIYIRFTNFTIFTIIWNVSTQAEHEVHCNLDRYNAKSVHSPCTAIRWLYISLSFALFLPFPFFLLRSIHS